MSLNALNPQKGPRILHVITPSHMAGAETFLGRLLKRSRGGPAQHLCISSHSAAGAAMRAAGMEFDSLGIGGKANPLALARLRDVAADRQADLLQSHLSTASWWCGWLEQLGGLKSIGHVHGFTSAMWHRRQSHLIACSHAVKRDLVEKGIPANRVTVLHYPTDPDDVQPRRSPAAVRAELGADRDTPVVGTFAHLSVKKGYRELLQAAQIVLRQMPRAQFWCFGEGVLRKELEERIRSAGISHCFKLFGFREDVADLMQAIDVMCLPSHREPFGLVYLEAGLAEKPVIACHAGGAPEVVLHGDTGLLVPPLRQKKAPQKAEQGDAKGRRVSPATGSVPGQPESQIVEVSRPQPRTSANDQALAEAILHLLDNPVRAAAMGRCGRQFVLDRFGWANYLQELNKLYQLVLSEQPQKVSTMPTRAA